MTTTIVKRADQLVSGDVITKSGATPRLGKHSITVTDARPNLVGNILIEGFDGFNSEPRVMFRGLRPNLPVDVEMQ